MSAETLELAELLKQLDSPAAVMGQASQELIKTSQMKSDILRTVSPVVSDQQGNTPTSLQQELTGKLQAQQEGRSFATAAGLAGPNNDLVAMGIDLRNNLREAVMASQEIDKLNSISPLTDPLGWVQAKLGMHPAFAKYEAAANNFNLLSAGMTDLNNQIQETAVTQKAIEQSVSAESNASRVQGLKINIDNANKVALANKIVAASEPLEAVLKASDLEYRAIQDKISNRMRLRSLELQEAAAGRASLKNADDQAMQKYYEQGHVAIYGRPPEIPITADSLKNKIANNDPKIVALIRKGIDADGLATDDPRFYAYGNTPAEAANMMRAASPTIPKVVLDTYRAVVQPSFDKLSSDPALMKQYSKAADREAFINDDVLTTVARLNNPVNYRDASNPYQLPGVAQLVDTKYLKGLGADFGQGPFKMGQPVLNTQLYKKILGPVVATGGLHSMDPQQLIELSAAGVRSKQISAEQAAQDLQQIIAYAMLVNNRVRQFSRLGLPDQESYRVRLTLPGLTGKQEVFNLNNGTDLKRAFLKFMLTDAVLRGESKLPDTDFGVPILED